MPNSQHQTTIVKLAPSPYDDTPAPVTIQNVTDVRVLDNGTLLITTRAQTEVYAPGTWAQATTVAGTPAMLLPKIA